MIEVGFVKVRLPLCLAAMMGIIATSNAQVPSETPTDDVRRAIEDDMFAQPELAVLERSIPNVYHDVLSGAWRTTDGVDKYRNVVQELREQWGHNDPLAPLEMIDAYYAASEEERFRLDDSLDRATGILLNRHIRSERLRETTSGIFDLLHRHWAETSPERADSFEACIKKAEFQEDQCLLDRSVSFEKEMLNCITDRRSKDAPIQMVDLCVIVVEQKFGSGTNNCHIDLVANSKSCLE